jgi:hypothetical protein
MSQILDDAALAQAVRVLTEAGAVFSVPSISRRSWTLEQTAAEIGFSISYVRKHLAEFPNAWRAPGGGDNGVELRIPVSDVDAFMARRRIKRE